MLTSLRTPLVHPWTLRTPLAHPWAPLHQAASIYLQASGTVRPNVSVPGLSTSHEKTLVSLPVSPALLACRRPAGALMRPCAPRGAPRRAAAADGGGGGGWTAAVCAAAQAAVARHPRRSPRAPPAQEVVAGRPPSTSAQPAAAVGSAQVQARGSQGGCDQAVGGGRVGAVHRLPAADRGLLCLSGA